MNMTDITKKELLLHFRTEQERSSDKQYTIAILMDMLSDDDKMKARKIISNHSLMSWNNRESK